MVHNDSWKDLELPSLGIGRWDLVTSSSSDIRAPSDSQESDAERKEQLQRLWSLCEEEVREISAQIAWRSCAGWERDRWLLETL